MKGSIEKWDFGNVGIAVAAIAIFIGISVPMVSGVYKALHPTPWEKAGLRLLIDPGTGCHYLARRFFGSPTPRMGADGEHICTGPED